MLHGLDFTALHACVSGQWSPQIGDPTVVGWITAVAYGVCALAAALIVLRKSKGRVRVFWAIISVAMLFLGMNKQLDLQSDLTAIGRCISQHQEWYGDRREVQLHFIEGLLAAIAAILGIALWLMRRHLWQNGLALLGLGSVASFVAVRAISIHHVDALINLRPFDVRLIAILELTGLVLIAVNAFLLLRGSVAQTG